MEAAIERVGAADQSRPMVGSGRPLTRFYWLFIGRQLVERCRRFATSFTRAADGFERPVSRKNVTTWTRPRPKSTSNVSSLKRTEGFLWLSINYAPRRSASGRNLARASEREREGERERSPD